MKLKAKNPVNALQKWLAMSATLLLLAGCFFGEDNKEKKNNDDNHEYGMEMTAEDIPADPESEDIITYYSLRENEIVDKEDADSENWDIGLKGTSFIVNGGINGPGDGAGLVLTSTNYNDMDRVPDNALKVDGPEGNAITGWYTYTGSGTAPYHSILVTPGTVIIVRTADGKKYAKIKITSYYKGNPASPNEDAPNADDEGRDEARYYNFKYEFIEGPEDPEEDVVLGETEISNESSRLDTLRNIPSDTGKTGAWTFVNLGDLEIVNDSNSTDWDLAFSGTGLYVNGGSSGPGEGMAQVFSDTSFEKFAGIPEDGFTADAETEPTISGWYTYTGAPLHQIIANENTVIVVLGADGETYFKVEIISYYSGGTAQPAEGDIARHFWIRVQELE